MGRNVVERKLGEGLSNGIGEEGLLNGHWDEACRAGIENLWLCLVL